MYAKSILAVSGLVSMVAAVPMAGQRHHQHHARDYIWETMTEEVIVTVPVTRTVWLEPGETAPSHNEHHGDAHGYNSPSVETTSTAEVEPAYTPESSSTPVESTPESIYVAPTPSSTSVYVAPTSIYVVPTPTSVYVAPTPTYEAPSTSAAAPVETPETSSGGSGVSYGMGKAGTSYSGDLTYYDPSAGLGACGWPNTTTQAIVAVSHIIFDSYGVANSNDNPLCGKYVTIMGTDGKSYQAEIVDKCPGCTAADLDLSPDFFNNVTDHGDGRVSNMKWSFN